MGHCRRHFYIKYWCRLYDYFRKLSWKGQIPSGRISAYYDSGYFCRIDGRIDHYSGMLRIWCGARSRPGLVFITLPNVFNQMTGGKIWGALFFLFMSFASLSTVIAVFENIISYSMDRKGWSRGKAVIVNMVAMILLSLPAVFGFNILSGIQPLGAGTNIMDLEDFIVSNNILPLGSVVFVMFCVSKYGWGWKNFIKEADTGEGLKFPCKRTEIHAICDSGDCSCDLSERIL